MTSRVKPKSTFIPINQAAMDKADRTIEFARRLARGEPIPTRPRSPLEQMVDRACGITPEERARLDLKAIEERAFMARYAEFLKPVPGRTIRLRCPICGAEQATAPLLVIDPPETAVQIFPCGGPACPTDKAELVYLDAAGQRIPFP